MDGKTIIILILSSLLSAAIGYLYANRRAKKMFPQMMKKGGEKKMKGGENKMKGGENKMKGGEKKMKMNNIKGAKAVQGEPAAVQNGVAQYVLENGL